MRIEPFTDQYELAAALYGWSATQLRDHDEGRTQPVRRWIALSDECATAAVTAWDRPDDRLFLSFVGDDEGLYGRLGATAHKVLTRPVRTVVDAEGDRILAALQAAGFSVELESESFRINFGKAIDGVRRAWLPSGLSVRPADEVDEERLFALDNTLRQDVPGTDGWRGDRAWFREELSEAPPFDPSAYLVAVEDRNDEYVGLVRMWRNPNGPRLGLIGVVPAFRRTVIAAALLRQALTAAGAWGHETFTTETSLVNKVIYPRMKRLGAESLGRFLQLVLG